MSIAKGSLSEFFSTALSNFRKVEGERCTFDKIFAARQLRLEEKCQNQNGNLNTIFVDFTQDFDTVSREGLWRPCHSLAARTSSLLLSTRIVAMA